MNKLQLISKLAEEFERSGCKTNITLEPRSNPLIGVSKGNKKIYITACEVWIKPAKYKDIVFCGISPKIQKSTEVEKTYVVIIDFQPIKQKYILAKLDDTNHRRNKIDYLIFHFKRPDYGGFYNTEHLSELISEIQKVVT